MLLWQLTSAGPAQVLGEEGGTVIFFFAQRSEWDVLELPIVRLLQRRYDSSLKGQPVQAIFADTGKATIRRGVMEALGVSVEDLPSAAIVEIARDRPTSSMSMSGFPLSPQSLQLVLDGHEQGSLKPGTWPIQGDSWGAFLQAMMALAPAYFMAIEEWMLWHASESLLISTMDNKSSVEGGYLRESVAPLMQRDPEQGGAQVLYEQYRRVLGMFRSQAVRELSEQGELQGEADEKALDSAFGSLVGTPMKQRRVHGAMFNAVAQRMAKWLATHPPEEKPPKASHQQGEL